MLRRLVVWLLPLVAAGYVDVEIYYGPYDANSARWLSMNMPELMGADLQGVRLKMLPYVLEHGGEPNPVRCRQEGVPCHYLAAPMCALQSAAMPAPPAEVRSNVNFAVCDLLHAHHAAVATVTHTKQDIQQCAMSSGLDYLSLAQCILTANTTYLTRQVRDVWQKLPAGPAKLPMPYVFVDGQFMDIRMEPDLLKVICSKFYPQPAACALARKYELGKRYPGYSLRLPDETPGSSHVGAWIMAMLCAGAVAAVVSIIVIRRVYGPQVVPLYGDEIRTLVIQTPKEGTQVAV